MNKQEVFSELVSLSLPATEYVVVGGAALTARGIRETDDIDLVVTPSLFEILRCAGWRQEMRPNGKPSLHRGRIEAYLDVNCGDFERDISWLLVHAETVDGVPLVDLETLAGFKLSYGRNKDIRDLALIERYRVRQIQRSNGTA